MKTIYFKVNDDNKKLIDDYVQLNNLNLSQFVKNTILEKIENELEISETFAKELLDAKESAKREKLYTLQQVRKEFGI